MKNELIRQRIFEFLSANAIGILSTIHFARDAPESAVVGFGNNEDLELVFGTNINTRKYRNLQINPNVSLVIGWSSITGSLQYEGIAREIDNEELKDYASLLIMKNENHREYIGRSEQKFFVVSPTWIRFYDNAGSPAEVYELDSF